MTQEFLKLLRNPLTGEAAFKAWIYLTFRTGDTIWFKFGHNKFYKGKVLSNGNVEIWGTRGDGENRRLTSEHYLDGYGFLSQLASNNNGGVFFLPGKPEENPLKIYCTASNDIGGEMDDGTNDEQWARVELVSQYSGLVFASIVGSGGKSIHPRLALTVSVPIAQWQYYQRLLAIVLIGDPAVTNPHQPMRVPGFFRREKGKEQTLEFHSYEIYTPTELESGFEKCFEKLNFTWHRQTEFSEVRWSEIQSILASKVLSREEKEQLVRETLALPEAELPTNKRKRELEERRKQREQVNASSSYDLLNLVEQANQKLGSDAFDWTGHNFKWSGDKARGGCPWHESSTGNAGWVAPYHKKPGQYGYACPTCTENKQIDGFAYWFYQKHKRVTPYPEGKQWVEAAKDYCAFAGIVIPEYVKNYQYNNNEQQTNSRTNTRTSRTSGNGVGDDKSTVPGMDDGRPGSGNSTSSTATGRSQANRNNENHGFKEKPDLVVNRRYLGNIPLPEKGFGFIKSAKDTGKTQSSEKVTHDAIQIGTPGNLLTHRVLLGRNLCGRLGFTWIDEKNEGAVPGLQVGLCFNSLWKVNPDNYRGGIIIIDEIEQGIWYLLNSNTCKETRTLLLRRFKELITTVINSGGLVIGMDADLSQNTIDYLVALTEQEIKPWVCVNEWKPTPKYFAEALVTKYYSFDNARKSSSNLGLKFFFTNLMDFKTPKIVMYDFSNPARMIREIESCLEKGEKLYICCDSRDGRYSAKGVAGLLLDKFPSLKLLRVDAETTSTPDHPALGFVDEINSKIIEWDVVICSPSVGSGVDIKVRGHFDKVFGIFNGVIPDWEARQALARVREYIPRHVWAKKQGIGFVSRTAKLTDCEQIVKKLHDDFEKNSKLAELMLPSTDYKKLIQGYHDPSHLIAFANIAARVNKSILYYRSSMYEGLRSEGYEIDIISDSELESKLYEVVTQHIGMSNSGASYEEMKPIMELEQKLREELAALQEPDREIVSNLGAASKARKQESYIEISNAPLITVLEFEALHSKKLRTLEEDYKIEKYNLSQIYSEVEITEPLVKKTKADNYHSKIQRHYFLQEQVPKQYTKLLDRKQLASQISVGGQLYLPDLKNRTLEIDFLRSINIMQWVNPELEISSQTETLLAWCKGLLDKHEEIQLRLGINLKPHIPPEDSTERVIKPFTMLQTMLDYIGLKYKFSKRTGGKGSRVRHYKLDTETFNDERADIFARWDAKYAELVTKHQAEPVTLPWEEAQKGKVNIPNSDSRPPNSYIDKTKSLGVDTEPVDTNTDVPVSIWKGVSTRVREAVANVNIIWRDLYAKVSGADCTVDTEPYPVNVEGGIQWQVWARFVNGSYKAVPANWLDCCAAG